MLKNKIITRKEYINNINFYGEYFYLPNYDKYKDKNKIIGTEEIIDTIESDDSKKFFLKDKTNINGSCIKYTDVDYIQSFSFYINFMLHEDSIIEIEFPLTYQHQYLVPENYNDNLENYPKITEYKEKMIDLLITQNETNDNIINIDKDFNNFNGRWYDKTGENYLIDSPKRFFLGNENDKICEINGSFDFNQIGNKNYGYWFNLRLKYDDAPNECYFKYERINGSKIYYEGELVHIYRYFNIIFPNENNDFKIEFKSDFIDFDTANLKYEIYNKRLHIIGDVFIDFINMTTQIIG